MFRTNVRIQPRHTPSTHTPTSSPTLYPTATCKIHVKPDYVSLAEEMFNSEELQIETYGRRLDGDELSDIYWGVIDWHSYDFMRRCIREIPRLEHGLLTSILASKRAGTVNRYEYPPATDTVRLRLPEAELFKDTSQWHYYRFFHSSAQDIIQPRDAYTDRGARSNRYVTSIYQDRDKGIFFKAESVVRFKDCETVDLRRANLSASPFYFLGNSYVGGYEPLEPEETEDASSIKARRHRKEHGDLCI